MTKMERHVRTIYLYLFALLGLLFVAIGGVRLLDMGLRTYVFREADSQERLREPPPYPVPMRQRMEVAGADSALTPEERSQVRAMITEYDAWRERSSLVDPVRARRHREAAGSLAMILVGLPLYLYHWRRIRIETQERRRRMAERSEGVTP
jgi:hypothetical protein